ncbi:MAG: HAD family hydrolase [Treponema sp.]|nr:HAD family hydrolase [Treponema sp.]
MKTDGIILDIDGTIWNTTGIVAGAWNIAIEKTNKKAGASIPEVNAEILQQQFGKPMNVIADNLFKGISEEEREELLEMCCNFEQQALEENQKDITYPAVIRVIKELSQSFDIFIVSNCQDGYIELTMKKNGIEEYIKDWECFGHNGKSKAENIKTVALRNKLSFPVYVGDTLGDLLACQEAEVPFIWAKYGFGKEIPEEKTSGIINSFEELKAILEN